MLLPLFLMSCLNKDNNIVSLLKEWEQKEILFPKEMYFTTMLRDTTYYNLQSEYKILAYVDSIGCTSCKLMKLIPYMQVGSSLYLHSLLIELKIFIMLY